MSDNAKVEICFELDKSLRDVLEEQAIQERITLEQLITDAIYKRIPKIRGRIDNLTSVGNLTIQK